MTIMVTLLCAECRNTFQQPHSEVYRVFCSDTCRQEYLSRAVPTPVVQKIKKFKDEHDINKVVPRYYADLLADALSEALVYMSHDGPSDRTHHCRGIHDMYRQYTGNPQRKSAQKVRQQNYLSTKKFVPRDQYGDDENTLFTAVTVALKPFADRAWNQTIAMDIATTVRSINERWRKQGLYVVLAQKNLGQYVIEIYRGQEIS